MPWQLKNKDLHFWTENYKFIDSKVHRNVSSTQPQLQCQYATLMQHILLQRNIILFRKRIFSKVLVIEI